MGGSSSRFNETEWDKADGKLASCDSTIDNALPTDAFGIYYLTKLGVSQREYDVTDSNSNFIYKTRAVEGTLAWFDVLNADDCPLLRVQADLSRRYWVIYRYGIPSFTGQLWDEAATERLNTDDGARRPLFRRACITVSWARYHAVVDMYEPAPPAREETEEEYKDERNNENVLVNFKQENKNEAAMCSKHEQSLRSTGESKIESSIDRAVVVSQNSDCLNINDETKPKVRGTEESKNLLIEDAVGLHYSEEEFRGERTNDAPLNGRKDCLLRDHLEQTAPVSISQEDGRPQISERSSLEESIRLVQSKALESVAAPYRPASRDEGVITLNNPLLKVQEINSIVGQHQTMLIHKEEARQLKREELLIEAKLAKENVEINGNDDLDSDEEMLKYLWYECSYHTSESEDDDQITRDDKHDNEGAAESNLVNVSSDGCLEIVSSQADDHELELNRSTSSDEYKDEQPLVGYWTWQNSIRVHRMKMHLAKSSDLALHVVLAVVTNQLRYERHATVAVAL
jgi:hypothetical protein